MGNQQERLSRPDFYMNLALLTSLRSTCARRRVGAVLIDQRGIILSLGYNGVPQGFPHCNEGHPCQGIGAKSGTKLDECHAIHAEMNALLWCPDVSKIHAAYVTASPCIECTKVLLNTDCKYIYFAEPYAHDEASQDLWHEAKREWFHHPVPGIDLRRDKLNYLQ